MRSFQQRFLNFLASALLLPVSGGRRISLLPRRRTSAGVHLTQQDVPYLSRLSLAQLLRPATITCRKNAVMSLC